MAEENPFSIFHFFTTINHATDTSIISAAERDVSLVCFLLILSWRRLYLPVRIMFPIIIVFLILPVALATALYNTTFTTDYPKEMALLSIFNTFGNLIIGLICFGVLYREAGVLDVDKSERSESIIDCIYFATIVFTTVGFGDIIPCSTKSRLLVCFEALIGYLTMGAIVVELAAFLRALIGRLPV